MEVRKYSILKPDKALELRMNKYIKKKKKRNCLQNMLGRVYVYVCVREWKPEYYTVCIPTEAEEKYEPDYNED